MTTHGRSTAAQITGQIALERESLIRMKQTLENLSELLQDQLQTILSCKEKISVTQKRGDMNDEVKKQIIENLQDFERRLN